MQIVETPNVLLVDDRPENLFALEHALDGLDCRILKATSGQEALRLLKTHDVALVLLDVQMPEMDGFEVAALMRIPKRTKHTPIIFVTAISKEQQYIFRGYESGAVDYLFKPVEPTILRSKTRVFLDLYRKNTLLKKQTHDLEEYARNLEREIAERKKAEEELQSARDAAEASQRAAEDANRAKSTFLSNMSHELRTPLNGILGYAQILKRAPGLSTTVKDGVDIIYKSGNHLLTLINDILDLSKIEARKMELYPDPIHLETFLEGIADIIRMHAQQKGVGFVYAANSDLSCGIEADEKRLRQVLLNLLSNAVKFTEPGGTVEFKILDLKLQIEEETGDKSQISNLKFQITDTGVGMTPEQMETIFLPFEQVGDHTRRAEGTGLGLAISRQLVELMGSALQVRSQAGEGTTFWFEAAFPVIHTHAAQSVDAQRDILGYSGSHQKVLVVDDRQDNRLVLLNLLEPLGFEIILAENGLEGVNKARDMRPDFILMDLVMPVMTGFEAVKELRRIPELGRVPIIAISASTVDMDQEQSRALGCQAFLLKPFQAPDLFALIESFLPITWLYEENEAADNAVPQPVEVELVPPPSEELTALYELAKLGKMRGIREQADHLEELDSCYLPFADRLRELAKAFQGKAIVEFVAHYMKETS